ncbi:MAG: homoserine kinase [Saprospiraceae bacterium]
MELGTQTPKNIDISRHSGVKVFAPASVANVACGFDILGFALESPGDEIIVKFADQPGLRITSITGADKKLPLEVERNTAGVAAIRLLESLGKGNLGIEMEIHKKMPFGSGLGSSAASAVAGAMAINELLGRPYEKKDILPFAIAGESIASGAVHADNVAPSLLGGFILVRNSVDCDVVRIPVPRGMYAVVVYPKVEVLTKDARKMLKADVPLNMFIQQSANLGGFIMGMVNSDFSLIKRSLVDLVIEPQRAVLIPFFSEVQHVALEGGALGCSISGSGPSIFALFNNSLLAEETGKLMLNVFRENKIKADLFVSPINNDGAKLL